MGRIGHSPIIHQLHCACAQGLAKRMPMPARINPGSSSTQHMHGRGITQTLAEVLIEKCF